jgi:hypothetical protein
MMTAGMDACQTIPLFRGQRAVALQQLSVTQHSVEWCANLMTHARQEFRLGLARTIGLGFGSLPHGYFCSQRGIGLRDLVRLPPNPPKVRRRQAGEGQTSAENDPGIQV